MTASYGFVPIPKPMAEVRQGFLHTLILLDLAFAALAERPDKVYFVNDLPNSLNSWLPSFYFRMPEFRKRTEILLRNCVEQ
jgi:hypothetical protein